MALSTAQTPLSIVTSTDAVASVTEDDTISPFGIGDGPDTKVLRLTLSCVLPAVFLINTVVLVNIIIDMKKHVRTFLILQVGLVLSDMSNAMAELAFTEVQRRELPQSSLECIVSTFFVRLGMTSSSTFVMLMALERYLKLSYPLWATIHLNVKGTLVTVLITMVILISLTAASFLHADFMEWHQLSFCSQHAHHHGMDIHPSLLLPVHLAVTILLAVVFNMRVCCVLHYSEVFRRGFRQSGAAESKTSESTLRQLVACLTFTSLVFRIPQAIHCMLLERGHEMQPLVTRSVNLVYYMAFVVDPMAFLMLTGRYRRRLSSCSCKDADGGTSIGHTSIHRGQSGNTSADAEETQTRSVNLSRTQRVRPLTLPEEPTRSETPAVSPVASTTQPPRRTGS